MAEGYPGGPDIEIETGTYRVEVPPLDSIRHTPVGELLPLTRTPKGRLLELFTSEVQLRNGNTQTVRSYRSARLPFESVQGSEEAPDPVLVDVYREALEGQNPEADPRAVAEAADELARLLGPLAESDKLTAFTFDGDILGLQIVINQQD